MATMITKIVSIGIALATRTAAILINGLKTANVTNGFSMLRFGLAVLVLTAFQN